MQQNKTHNSLEKALKILQSFIPFNQEKGVNELSKQLGLNKSTTSRILHVLEEYGFLQQNLETRKFSLGPSISELGWAINQSLNSNLIRIAIPYVDKLRDKIEETVVLEIPSSHSTIIGYMAEGPGPVRIKGTIGERHWYHAAAGAKAILAFSPVEFREKILARELIKFTPRTITEREKLKKEMERIRRLGFSFDNEERNIGIRAFGCPIFGPEGKPVAGLVVAGPISRINWGRHSEIVPLLRETAMKISRQLGYGIQSLNEKERKNLISQKLNKTKESRSI